MPLIQLPQEKIVAVRDALRPFVDKDIVDDAVSSLGLDPEDLGVEGVRARLGKAIQHFNTRGRIVGFLDTIRVRNPDARGAIQAALQDARDQLDEVAKTLGSPSVGVIGRGHRVLSFGEGKTGWLQRLVRKDPKSVEHAALLMRMVSAGQRVCRVERETGAVPGTTMGTGFLIGTDLVLTNYHVIEPVLKGHVASSSLRCRFGYQRDATGTVLASGAAVTLAAGVAWLVDKSPYAPGDNKPGAREPTNDELDFALLKLTKASGDEEARVAGTELEGRRGWYDLDRLAPAAPVKSDELIVVGHPEGQPLTHAMGAMLCYAAHELRMRHDAYTMPGSSGSPVFDAEYRLVGLHHAGDPDLEHDALYNQAIPLPLIAARTAATRKS